MSSVYYDHMSADQLKQYPRSVDEIKMFKMFDIMNEISTITYKGHDYKQTLSSVLNNFLSLTQMEHGAIYFKDKTGSDYVLTVHSNVSKRFLQINGKIGRAWEFFYPVINERRVMAVQDTLAPFSNTNLEKQILIIKEGFRSFVNIPLINEYSVEGILMIGSSNPHIFSDIEIKIFSIVGQQLGIAINQFNFIEELRTSHETYYDLFNNANDAIYTHDLSGNFLSINQSCADMLGCTKEELLRSNIRDFLTEESFEIAKAIQEYIIDGEKNSIPTPVLEIIRMDKTTLFLEFNIRPLIKNDTVIGVHGIARDVDKRFNATKNLLIFTKDINLSSDGIDISDADHKITFINEAGAKMFGYSKAELLGQSVDIFYSEEDLPNLEENVVPSMEKYGYWNGLILGRKKDGTAFPLEVTLTSIMDNNGKALLNIGVFRVIKSNMLHT
jgi:PAS domain S-box-containing protein